MTNRITYQEALERYPVGLSVSWMRGKRQCYGVVYKQVDDKMRILIKNEMTGSIYYLAPNRLTIRGKTSTRICARCKQYMERI